MQRWIALTAVFFCLLLGGSWYGYRQYRANRPHPVWVPLAINPSLSFEEREKTVKMLEKTFAEEKVLQAICSELSLQEQWEIPGGADCVKELSGRIFVKTGQMDTPKGPQPALLVGIRGKAKHQQVSNQICMRMMNDVAKTLGLPPPPKGASQQP